MPTIEELKIYLGIDGEHLDALLADFLKTAQEHVEAILRYKIATIEPTPQLVKEALRYAVGVLYTSRESANIQELTGALARLLEPLRKQVF